MRQKTPAVDENRSHYATPSVQASLRILRIAMANQIRKTGPNFAKKIINCKSVSKKINILFFDRTCFKNTSYQSSNTWVCNRQDWMRGLVKNALYNPSETPIFESQGGSPAEWQVRNSKLEFGWPTMFRSGRMSLARSRDHSFRGAAPHVIPAHQIPVTHLPLRASAEEFARGGTECRRRHRELAAHFNPGFTGSI